MSVEKLVRAAFVGGFGYGAGTPEECFKSKLDLADWVDGELVAAIGSLDAICRFAGDNRENKDLCELLNLIASRVRAVRGVVGELEFASLPKQKPLDENEFTNWVVSTDEGRLVVTPPQPVT